MKIALIGSAPSWSQAPFNDPSWEIWACNARDYPRIDRYFQFHPDQDLEIYPGLIDWMKARKDPVYLRHARADVPASITYPLDTLKAKYGSWFFTSSVAYMLALALEQEGLEEIGLWGITMQDSEEYRAQRPGCHFFLQLAKMRGIKLTVPPDCEMLTDGALYLYDRNHRLYAKIMACKTDFVNRQNGLQQTKNNLIMRMCMLKGALEVTLPKDQIEAQLAECVAQQPAIERDLIMVDAVLQLMAHAEESWLQEMA